MRTIGVIIIALVLFPSFQLQKTMEHVNNPAVSPDNTFRFHIPVTKFPALITGTKKKADIDTNDLKQSSWYANAIKQIEESEYEIKPVDKSTGFASPNRRQNLRAFYTADKFTLEPRADDNWKLQLTVEGIYSGKKKIYSLQENALAVTAKNKIQFNHNNKFTIEYINSKEGVRQNFIIQKQPASQLQTINIKLQTNNGWYINKVHDKELHFAKLQGDHLSKKITYNSLKVWDANNKELDVRFVVNKKHTAFEIEVNTMDATYPITIDPISTTPAAIVESNQATAYMGLSVASAGDVNGDGYSDVIVGAYFYDNGQTDEGAAFVYHGSATGISTTAAAMVESNQANANMGIFVASAGDVNSDGYSDVIVGAYYYDNGQLDEGAAFVYHGSATGISTTATSIVESNQASAYMGVSVASAGDVNSDGYSDVIVGAYDYANGQTLEGAFFVYHGSVTGINTSAVAIVESNQADARMGYCVAPAGDVNGDGYSDVIVGAFLYDNGQTDEGVAFVYHGSATGISTTSTSTIESNQASAKMGISVSSAGDVNGDGYSDVIIGAYLFDNGQAEEGAAFVYHGSPTGINTTVAAFVESNQANAFMGVSVASAGDINGDGYSDVVVGAEFYDNGQAEEGAAFVYLGSTTGINTVATATVESNQVDANMGISVSSAGDVNGDGYSDVIAGAWLFDNGEIDEGAAFVYHGSASGISTTIQAQLESNQSTSNMGYSVASAGDVNGDGYSDVIVGAYRFDNSQNDEGAVFVYHGSAIGISATIQTQLESDQADANMGYSVASAGDVNGDGYGDIIVGAWVFDSGETDEGVAFVYHGSPSGITSVIQTQLEFNQVNANMGCSVAGAGDVNGDGYGDVIVGLFNFSNGQTGEGAAFIYHGSSTGITTIIQTQLEGNQANARFGYSVASAGDVNGDGYSDVIVGAFNFTNNQNNEGAAFVYHGSSVGISTTIQAQLESNQNNAMMGLSVAGAGDVNGDGYSDVIVGAYNFTNGQTNEGVAFVYHGSIGGITNTIQAQLEYNQASSYMGYSVSSAGDINGDGYSDVIVGALNFTNGQSNEGAAFIYHGSTTGITTTIQAQFESNQAFAQMGVSVAGAGDVNGDGYSDVIVGIISFTNVQSNEGAAFVYLGNSPGTNKRNNLRLYNTDLVTPIQRSNILVPNLFGAGLFSKSPLGRVKGKLVWEVKKQGIAFSGSPITNSVAFTGKQSSYSDLGISGTELKNLVQKVNFQNKVRVRVEYDKATAITGQMYGPWRYPPGYLQGAHGMNSLPLPVKFISFNALKQDQSALLKWITVDEEPGVKFDVQHSTDGINFTTLAVINGSNQTQNEYEWPHTSTAKGNNFYRIKAVENQKEAYTATRKLNFSEVTGISIYPNPAVINQTLNIKYAAISVNQSIKISLINSSGQMAWQKEIVATSEGSATLNIPDIPSGAYLLLIKTGQWTSKEKIVIIAGL